MERYQEWLGEEKPDIPTLTALVVAVGEEAVAAEHARIRSRYLLLLMDTPIKDARASEDNLVPLLRTYAAVAAKEQELAESIFGDRSVIYRASIRPAQEAVIARIKALEEKLGTAFKRSDFTYPLLLIGALPAIGDAIPKNDAELDVALASLKQMLSRLFVELINDLKSTQVKPATVNPALKAGSHEAIGLKLSGLALFAAHSHPQPAGDEKHVLAATATVFDQSSMVAARLKVLLGHELSAPSCSARTDCRRAARKRRRCAKVLFR